MADDKEAGKIECSQQNLIEPNMPDNKLPTSLGDDKIQEQDKEESKVDRDKKDLGGNLAPVTTAVPVTGADTLDKHVEMDSSVLPSQLDSDKYPVLNQDSFNQPESDNKEPILEIKPSHDDVKTNFSNTSDQNAPVQHNKSLDKSTDLGGEQAHVGLTGLQDKTSTEEFENLEQGGLDSVEKHVMPCKVLSKCESLKQTLPQLDNAVDFIDEFKEANKVDTVTSRQMGIIDDEESNLIPDTMEENSINDKMSGECESLISEDSSSAIISDGNKINGVDIAQELVSESSCSEYPAGLDTPGPPTPMSASIETGSTGPTPAKRNRLGSIERSSHYKHPVFPASKLFEYQWPQESGPGGDWFFLQEQLSDFLDVKSFRRKFPELTRRAVDMKEREFLRDNLVVTETQCDLGLTAVKSEEVLDMMARDYPEKYRQYTEVIHEREKQKKIEKHKEYEVPKLEKAKMKMYMQKAMKSASEWNAGFIKERREERRAYFDQQTFNIHFPANKYKKLPPEATKIGAYPVAILPGQFTDSYTPYSSDELKYFPLNTALYDPPKTINHVLVSPTSQEAASEEDAEAKSGSGSDSDEDSSSSSDGSSDQEQDKDKKSEPETETQCRVCGKEEDEETGVKEVVRCSECARHGHPQCLDLTEDMVAVIKTYPWQCMECKTCVECMDPFDEDKMMFCDKCDRGYHTFCVGLKTIPNGPWKCQSCKGPETPKSVKPPSKRGRGRGRGRARGSGRGPGRPPKTPQTPMSADNSPKPDDSVSEPSPAESSPQPMDTSVTKET